MNAVLSMIQASSIVYSNLHLSPSMIIMQHPPLRWPFVTMFWSLPMKDIDGWKASGDYSLNLLKDEIQRMEPRAEK